MKKRIGTMTSWVMLFAVGISGCVSDAGQRTLTMKLPTSLTGTPANPPDEKGNDAAELPTRETVKACLATARQLEQQGHILEARLLYEKARGIDPKAAPYARHLATLYEREGDYPHAQIEYQAALQTTPRDADLLNDFGYLYYRQANWTEAEAQFRKALATVPDHPRATINLGQTLAQQGRYPEAFDIFSKIVGPAAAHSNVGTIMAKQGRSTEAQQAFRNALALNPNLPQPRAFLAYYEQP